MDMVLMVSLLLHSLGGRLRGPSPTVDSCGTWSRKGSLRVKTASLHVRDSQFSDLPLSFYPSFHFLVISALLCTHKCPHEISHTPGSTAFNVYTESFHQQLMGCSELQFTCRSSHIPAAQVSCPRPPYASMLSHSVLSDSASLWTAAHQAPLSMAILQARILEWVAFPSPGDLSHPGIEPTSAWQAGSLPRSHLGRPFIL